MATSNTCRKEKTDPERVLVLRERRTSSHTPCAACGSRRKTWQSSLGWVCTVCFDQCKETAEQLIEVGSGVSRMRHAYELAVLSYHAAHEECSAEG
jgi:hypothetical protein